MVFRIRPIAIMILNYEHGAGECLYLYAIWKLIKLIMSNGILAFHTPFPISYQEKLSHFFLCISVLHVMTYRLLTFYYTYWNETEKLNELITSPILLVPEAHPLLMEWFIGKLIREVLIQFIRFDGIEGMRCNWLK